MFDVVHSLASAYGWDKKTILEQIYPDEVESYMNRIRRDDTNEKLTLLAISHNPHVKHPQKLIQTLEQQLRGFSGEYYTKDEMNQEDVNQLMAIKRQMQENANKRRRGGV